MRNRVSHFHSHRLNIQEVISGRLYSKDIMKIKTLSTINGKCPYCGELPGSITYGAILLGSNILRILVRCRKCKKLFFNIRKVKIKGEES